MKNALKTYRKEFDTDDWLEIEHLALERFEIGISYYNYFSIEKLF